jgi:hypothetical protein
MRDGGAIADDDRVWEVGIYERDDTTRKRERGEKIS